MNVWAVVAALFAVAFALTRVAYVQQRELTQWVVEECTKGLEKQKETLAVLKEHAECLEKEVECLREQKELEKGVWGREDLERLSFGVGGVSE